MEKEKTNNEGAQPQQQPKPVKDLTLRVKGELRNYQIEHLSDDAKNKIGIFLTNFLIDKVEIISNFFIKKGLLSSRPFFVCRIFYLEAE